MEKQIDVYSCLYDVADSIVKESEQSIKESVQFALEEYAKQDIKELVGVNVNIQMGEYTGYAETEVTYCQHGRCVDSEMEPCSMTVDLEIEFDVYKLLADGVFDGKVASYSAMMELRHDDRELDDSELEDLDEELTRSFEENIEWSEFKRC